MTGSTLNPPGESQPGTGVGHTTGALGPSDSSDSGSDIRGAVKRPEEIEDALDAHALEGGSAELGSDTDRYGTGERASADGDSNLTVDGDVLPRTADSVEDIAESTAGGQSDDRDSALDDAIADSAAKRQGLHADFDEAAVQKALKNK